MKQKTRKITPTSKHTVRPGDVMYLTARQYDARQHRVSLIEEDVEIGGQTYFKVTASQAQEFKIGDSFYVDD